MRGIAILLSLLLLPLFLRAQTPTASEVENLLYNRNGVDIKRLFQQLNLPQEIADYYSDGHIEGYKWFSLMAPSGSSLNVLVLPCGIEGSPVLLLERIAGHWLLRDQEGMDCHYDDSASAELANITSHKQYDLLLHHDCQSHGTGYVEQHARVLRIVGSHFKVALDRTDVLHAFPPGDNPGGSFEESAFLPLGFGTIEQTRRSTTYGADDHPRLTAAVTTRRTFSWNGQRFIASPWQTLH